MPEAPSPQTDTQSDTQFLASWLASHDAPCPVCDYSLRNLTSDRCPECAAKLHLRVGSENLSLGPWLLAVISFALGVGFDAVMGLMVTILFVVSLFADPPVPPMVRYQHTILLGGFLGLVLCSGLGIILLVRRRRRWMMLARRVQWRWAIIIFILVFIFHLIAGLLMARFM